MQVVEVSPEHFQSARKALPKHPEAENLHRTLEYTSARNNTGHENAELRAAVGPFLFSGPQPMGFAQHCLLLMLALYMCSPLF